MIEKIPDQIQVQTGEFRGTTFDIIPKETFAMACRKINELVRAINELQDRVDSQDKVIDDCAADISRLESKQTPKTPKAELIEDYGYDLAEAVEECGDLFKKGPIEPVTITDVFNEMQQVRADLWNKIEWLGEKLDEIKGGDNE